MNRKLILVVFSIVVAGFGSLSIAEEREIREAGASELQEVVTSLDRSMTKMVRLLEHFLHNQRVELVLRRIELRERRLAPLGEELHRAERELIESKNEINRLKGMMAELEQVTFEEMRKGAFDPIDSGSLRMKREVKRELEVQGGEMEAMERRAQDLDNDLAAGRREISILDNVLEQLLDSKQSRQPERVPGKQ